MTLELTIDRIEEEKAILKSDDGETIIWPKHLLPSSSKESSILVFNIHGDKESEQEKKDLAKDILNELLDVEE